MRVTTFGVNVQYLSDLNSIMDKYQNLEKQMSTGRQLNQPSDNPVGFSMDIQLQTSLTNVTEWANNAKSANSKMQTTDSALGTLQGVLGNIRTLLVQASNGTNTASDLKNMASTAAQQIQNVAQIANTNDGQEYIFGGLDSTNAPLSGTFPGYTWSGSATGIQNTTIGKNVSLAVNVDGTSVFNAAPSGSNALLKTLQNINTDLSAGNTANLQTDLTDLDANVNQIASIRADLGGRMSRASAAQAQLSQLTNTLTSSKSNVEDANLAQVITQLSTQQTVYQASLQAGTHLILPTLADTLK